MPLYFFHVRTGYDLVSDDEGMELANLEEARAEAIESALELMANDLKSGEAPELRIYEVTDESGATVLTLPFADAVPK